jgi:hypothetical protein
MAENKAGQGLGNYPVHFHTVEVVGSNPTAPTIRVRKYVGFFLRSFRASSLTLRYFL